MSETITKLIVPVPCAIIEQDNRILVAQRNALGSLPLKWEFPGGKQEEGETVLEALLREIQEELSVSLEVGIRLPSTKRDDGWKEIELIPFICKLAKGAVIYLTEHEQMTWLSVEDAHTLDWAEADWNVLQDYLRYKQLPPVPRHQAD